MLGKEILGTQRQPARLGVPLQVFLTQIWPIVWQVVLTSNQKKTAGESVFPKSLCCCVTCGAATNDDEQSFILPIASGHLRRSAIGCCIRHAHNDLIVFNPRFIACKRVEGRRLLQVPGRYVETGVMPRSEERRVGKECRSWWLVYD